METMIPILHFRRFYDYAGQFLHESQDMQQSHVRTNLELKINHSTRVSGLCAMIADSMRLSGEEKSAAIIAGIYHDIGRFEQFKRYETFVDSASINHAQLGAEILTKGDCLNDIDPYFRKIIIESVLHHNCQNTPETIDEMALRYLRILRDADKLDILDLLCNYHDSRHEKRNDALELNLPDTDGYSDEIIELIFRNSTVPNILRKNYNDMKLVHLTWAFDLNYHFSFNLILKKRYLERIISHLPDDKTIQRVKKHVLDFVGSRT